MPINTELAVSLVKVALAPKTAKTEIEIAALIAGEINDLNLEIKEAAEKVAQAVRVEKALREQLFSLSQAEAALKDAVAAQVPKKRGKDAKPRRRRTPVVFIDDSVDPDIQAVRDSG